MRARRSNPVRVALAPEKKPPLFAGTVEQGEALEGQSPVESAGRQLGIEAAGAVGGSKGEEKLVRIGERGAALQPDGSQIAPDPGIPRCQLRGSGKLVERRVG